MDDRSQLNRRDFEKLSLAAFGGILAGAGAAFAADEEEEKPKKKEKNPLLSDPHVCRGLNTCKSKGKGKKNACAGQGDCATAEAHTCHAENACKGQGGCGEHPGENACKGKGECGVPLSDKAWAKARKKFEQLMKADGKKFGEAPAKAGKKEE